ncbi:hypothetical protein [Planococcus koreensis]|uniref:hypothetical protein n=1 Tax=Planococcus koreensis TaxID=112331 RepID=UPI0039FCFB6F
MAKMRLLKLKEFVMKSIMKEIREEVNPKTNWTLTNILWVANPIAISYIGLYVAGIVGKDHYAMTKELKLLKEGNREIEFELESILVKVSDLNFKLSDSTHALINFNEILKGYIVEIDFYENEQIEYQEIKKLY